MSIELKIMAANGSDLVDRVKDLFETFFKPDVPAAEPATVPEKLDEVVKEAVSIVVSAEADIFPATDQVGDKVEPKTKRSKLSKSETAIKAVYELEQDLRPRTKALVAAGKIAELKALFDKFGCDSVGKLKPDQFAGFMSESEKLL
jgi:hypothetical protein